MNFTIYLTLKLLFQFVFKTTNAQHTIDRLYLFQGKLIHFANQSLL